MFFNLNGVLKTTSVATATVDKIKSTQAAPRTTENASRQNKTFEVGEKVLVKSN